MKPTVLCAYLLWCELYALKKKKKKNKKKNKKKKKFKNIYIN